MPRGFPNLPTLVPGRVGDNCAWESLVGMGGLVGHRPPLRNARLALGIHTGQGRLGRNSRGPSLQALSGLGPHYHKLSGGKMRAPEPQVSGSHCSPALPPALEALLGTTRDSHRGPSRVKDKGPPVPWAAASHRTRRNEGGFEEDPLSGLQLARVSRVTRSLLVTSA